MKIIAVMFGLLLLQACGVKGPPMPPLGKAVATDQDTRSDDARRTQP